MSTTKEKSAKSTSGKSADSKSKAADSKSKAADSKSKSDDSKAKSTKSKAADSKGKSGDSHSHSTTNHDEIKKWIESHGGKPSTVKGTGKKGEEAGILRVDFPGYSGEDKLEEISWEEFFEKFDESNLEFLYQEKTADGKESRFNKFVARSK